jgi:quinol monooxygenase YgiN
MQLKIFARLHARPGMEEAILAAIRGVATPTRAEPGCLELGYYRSIRDPRLFFVCSLWRDEASFERHARLPHTVRFADEIERATGEPLVAARTRWLEGL